MRMLFTLSIVLLFGGNPGWTSDCSPDVLEHEPAEVLWSTNGVITAKAASDILLIQTRDHLRAVHPESGQKIWSYPLETKNRSPDYVVLESRIVVVKDDRYLDFLDRSTGELLTTIDVGEWIHFLTGPPLIAVTKATDANWSTLFHITPLGKIASTLVVNLVSDIFILNGVAIVETEYDSFDSDSVLAGYRLNPLEHCWSVESFAFNTQVIDGRLYFGNVSWENGAQTIDALTGELGELIPPRAPYEIGGSGAFDIQVIESVQQRRWSPDFAVCERLRRNSISDGTPKWTTDLPFKINRVKGILRDGETLYVAGSRDSDSRFLVELDWSSGEVLRAWSGVPHFWVLEKMDDIVFGYDHSKELAAIRVGGKRPR